MSPAKAQIGRQVVPAPGAGRNDVEKLLIPQRSAGAKKGEKTGQPRGPGPGSLFRGTLEGMFVGLPLKSYLLFVDYTGRVFRHGKGADFGGAARERIAPGSLGGRRRGQKS